MSDTAADDATAVPTVHVIDDDAGLCAAIVRLVRSIGYHGQAHLSVRGFLDAERAGGPSCIVLDVRLPDMSGLDLQASLDERGIASPVIMMTGFGDIPMSVRAMKAGAVDFLTKPFRDQDLIDAIAHALALDRERLRLARERKASHDRFGALTVREQQVFKGIVDGLMNKEIAERLALSIVTVKAHRGTLTRKMGVGSTAELVRMGQALGLGDA